MPSTVRESLAVEQRRFDAGRALAGLDRGMRFILPLVFAMLAAALLDAVVQGPQWTWNEVRLARAVALCRGYPLYPGRDTHGPVIGTLHAPLGHLLYTPLALLTDPTAAIAAGCALSALALLAAWLWLHLRLAGRGGGLAALYGFAACATIGLTSPGVRYGLMNVHVDATAWCCAVLAAGLLVIEPSRQALTVSALLGVASVTCKQTLAPVPLALACFVLLTAGPREFLRYAGTQIAATVLLAAAVLFAFGPPGDVLFNTVTLAGHLPPNSENHALRGIFELREESVAVVPALVFLLILFFLDPGRIRSRLARHRWLVFLLIAALQMPFALRGWTTAGGSTNHLGTVTLFLALAATLGLTGLWNSEGMTALLARALLLGIVVARIYLPWGLPHHLAALRDNPAETAFRYEKAHPGRAYFPEDPLAVLLAGGGLRHFDYAVFDRQQAGFPLTAAQWAAAVPPHARVIAWSLTDRTPSSSFVESMVARATPVVDPELPGWKVYLISPANQR